MRQITTNRLKHLLNAHEAPCISLYQPTHRRAPGNEQDIIRYRNLLKELDKSLREKYPVRQVREIMEKFQPLITDIHFWNQRTEGLAIFCSNNLFESFDLMRPVKELLVVADSFHTKPLVRVLQSADRFQVLCLNRREARLYEGNRDAMEEVDLAGVASTATDVAVDQRSLSAQTVGTYGKQSGDGGMAVHHAHGQKTDPTDAEMVRFFRAVDNGIRDHHSRPTELPLILVALAESQSEFRRISDNPFLLPDGIAIDPVALNLDDLRKQAWQVIEPTYLARLEKLKNRFHAAQAQQSASGDLSDVAKAAVSDQVATLLVEADRVIPGILERSTGAVSPVGPGTAHVDDMLDDLAELVLSKGGEVIVVPTESMPTESGLAAIYRY